VRKDDLAHILIMQQLLSNWWVRSERKRAKFG
jgi:hypothetical protein